MLYYNKMSNIYSKSPNMSKTKWDGVDSPQLTITVKFTT